MEEPIALASNAVYARISKSVMRDFCV